MSHEELRPGHVVEVKSPAEILATLDAQGMLQGLPFMPEMLRYAGRRLVVDKRTEKICDTIYPIASRRLPDTVILGDLRCDGSAHDGCQADCRMYWKSAWLRRVDQSLPARSDDPAAHAALAERLAPHTKLETLDGQIRYQCQNTELSRASTPLGTFDPRAYLRVYRSGNLRLGRFVRVVARAAVEELLRKLGRMPRPWIKGTSQGKARGPVLNLQPGDLVQVKSRQEIAATLDSRGKNRGLFFDREMLPYCGGTFRVRKRITSFIDEHGGHGRMVHLKTDCVTLEGAVCSGELSWARWLCPREIHGFWREIWLRRLDESPQAQPMPAQPEPALTSSPHEQGHHTGTAQFEDVAQAEADDQASESNDQRAP